MKAKPQTVDEGLVETIAVTEAMMKAGQRVSFYTNDNGTLTYSSLASIYAAMAAAALSQPSDVGEIVAEIVRDVCELPGDAEGDDALNLTVGDLEAILERNLEPFRQLSADDAALREAASELLAWYGPFNPTRHPPEINGAWLRLEAALSALPAQPCDKLVEALTVYASPNFWNEKHPELDMSVAELDRGDRAREALSAWERR